MAKTRNDDTVNRLGADFQERDEPNFAWKSVCSQYLALPGLRGFWPLSSFDNAPLAYDLSGQGRRLTAMSGHVPATYGFGYEDLIFYFDATESSPDYLRRPDEGALDIRGNESYVVAACRGITFGAWVNFDSGSAPTDMILSKRKGAAAASTQYSMHRRATGVLRASFSNGAAIETIDSVAVMDDGSWYFAAGRWQPNTDASCWLNGVRADAGASALGTLANTNADLQLMGRDDGLGVGGSTENSDGRICLAFLCCMALPNSVVWDLYQQSRAMFDV